ncbi:MAG: rhomboid family intramembrane serine protease [Bacteroidia bacterium]
MQQFHFIALTLLVVNLFVSLKGLASRSFFDEYCFEVAPILERKDYKRLITSGFLHVSWVHLFFNMFALLSFSNCFVEFELFVIYFAGLIGGNLLALYIYRNYGDYRAVGASGAVFGVIFAYIVISPHHNIGMFLIPLRLPAWLFGLIYVAYTIYGIQTKRDNIGHEAHLGGAICGLLVALFFYPEAIRQNYVYILLILVPSLVFLYSLYERKPTYRSKKEEYINPMSRAFDDWFPAEKKDNSTIDEKYNTEQNRMQAEVDRILDKINRLGENAITNEERKRLREYSEKLNRGT